jgi:predicted amidohydrolase
MSRPVLLRGARLIDPATGVDETGDLRVEDGRIAEIGDGLRADGAASLDCDGLVLAPALIDLCARVGGPEHARAETVDSIARAAAAGGVGTLALVGAPGARAGPGGAHPGGGRDDARPCAGRNGVDAARGRVVPARGGDRFLPAP